MPEFNEGNGMPQRSSKFLSMEAAEELLDQQEVQKTKGKQLEIKFNSIEEVPSGPLRASFFNLVNNEDGQPLSAVEFKAAVEAKFGKLIDPDRQAIVLQTVKKLNETFGDLLPGFEAEVYGQNVYSVKYGNLQQLLTQYVEPVCGADGKLLPSKKSESNNAIAA
jgi:hypothetical protein